LEYKR